MKIYTTFIIIVIFLIFNILCFSQNLLIEDFNYPVRDSLEGLDGWFRSGNNTSNNVKIISPGLSYTGYVGSGIGNTIFMNNARIGGDLVLHDITTQTSGTLFMSFMIRVDSLTSDATQGYNIGFDQSGAPTYHNTILYIQKVTTPNMFKFGLSKEAGGGVVFTYILYNTNTTYLVVLKYSFVSGTNNDSAKAFIFTSGVPSSEPVTPTAFNTSGTDVVDIGQVFLSNAYIQEGGLNNSPVRIDGIRIGKTWQSSVIFSLVKTISNEVPDAFKLHQNFPNPFNPSTYIRYEIPKNGLVKLVVFDILGHEVETLINEKQSAGTYEANWNASQYPSGVYFYRLITEGFSETKKMILLK